MQSEAYEAKARCALSVVGHRPAGGDNGDHSCLGKRPHYMWLASAAEGQRSSLLGDRQPEDLQSDIVVAPSAPSSMLNMLAYGVT
jgi:hypothetical protein